MKSHPIPPNAEPSDPAEEYSPPRLSGQPLSDEEKLRDYTRLKLAVAARVYSLRGLFSAHGDKERAARCDALLVKLAEDRFTLAVVGQFKRGKSSVMNALIGRELLPVGVLPLTSAVTVLRFGPRERLLIRRAHWAGEQEAPVEKLADYVTEAGNPGNREQVRTACVELPLPFLRRGLEFVDTPGVGSANEANTETTYAFLPECDAVLFVTSVEAPLNEAELKFLRDVSQHARKIFFVVNKTDLLAPAERGAVLDFITRTLRSDAGQDGARIFPVSARLSLEGRRRGDEALAGAGGLRDLETALAGFLAAEKAAVLLDSVVEKAARLAAREAAGEALGRLAGSLPANVLRERQEKLERLLQDHAAQRECDLRLLRDAFVTAALDRIASGMEAFWWARKKALHRPVERFLARAAWRTERQTAERAARALAGLAVMAALRQVRALAAPGELEADLRALPGWIALARGLGCISQLEAEVLGAAPAEDDGAEFMPPWPDRGWRTVRAAGMPLVGDTPAGSAWLPARCARAAWKRGLHETVVRSLENGRAALAAFAAQAIGNAFDAWASEVRARAESLEAAARAGIGGLSRVKGGDGAASLHARLDRLRAAVRAFASGAPLPEDIEDDDDGPATVETPAAPAPAEPEEPLESGFRTRGCATCERMAQVAMDYFTEEQFALAASENARNEFAARLGLCPVHEWQLEAVSSPVGTSFGHAKLMRRVSRTLEEAARDLTGARRGVRALAQPARACRACELQQAAEKSHIRRLAAFVATPAGREVYERSQGLCLRHLDQLVDAAGEDESRAFLLRHAARRFEELAEDMQSYGMKSEALRRQLHNTDEEDAYWRALTHFAGSRRVCCAFSCDGKF